MLNLTHGRLYRSRRNSVFAGVAGGIAEYFGMDATLVRLVVFLVVVGATGTFASLVYAVFAYLVPRAPEGRGARVYEVVPQPRATR